MSEPGKDPREVRVPVELLQALRPSIEALGMGDKIEDLQRLVPEIDLGLGVREMGMKLGALLKNCGLYRKGSTQRLMARLEGQWKVMSPERFCSWVERFVTCYKVYQGTKGNSYKGETSMGSTLAAKIMEVDEFLEQIPLIERTVDVRLPVMNSAGEIVLLKKGYNEQQKIWCDDLVAFDENLSIEATIAFWEEMCGEFPLADLKRDVPGALWQNRSFLVLLSACIGVYIKLIFEPGTMLPMIVVVGNDSGAGKSLLVHMILASVYGVSTAAPLPMSKGGMLDLTKLESTLETIARSFTGYLFFDDAPPNVMSNALNSFVSRPRHTGRIYGDNVEMFDVPNVTQVFLTGKNTDVSEDIMQRSLWVELFLPDKAEDVVHKIEMTPVWLGAPAQRSRFLAALWCMTRAWVKNGMTKSKMIKRRAPVWSEIVGGILEDFETEADWKICTIGTDAAGKPIQINPFAKPDLPMAGDKQADEMERLLIALVDEVEINWDIWVADKRPEKAAWVEPAITTTELVDRARELQLIVDLVGIPEDKPLNKIELRKLGRRLEKYRGKEYMRTTKGKKFKFGHRRQESGTVYPIVWID